MKKYAIIDGQDVVNLIEYENAPGNPVSGFDDSIFAIETEIAGPGWTYVNGVFTAPQPYPSWTLVDNVWTPPTPMPENGKINIWDENTLSWVFTG
jgi:hypothetical protein